MTITRTNTTTTTEKPTLCQALAQLLHGPCKAELPTASALPEEIESGNHEYKYTLAGITDQQLTHRVSQLLWRLKESVSHTLSEEYDPLSAASANRGSVGREKAERETAHYHVGVDDDGTPRGLSERDLKLSLQTLQEMARRADCDVSLVHVQRGVQGYVAQITFHRRAHLTLTQEQVCVALAGDANSGKSTLIGVLSAQERDNGRGRARLRVLAHNHELTSGRTSSVTQTVLHFTDQGKVICNSAASVGEGLKPQELAAKAKKLVSLVDLAGHARYLKTTLSGLAGHRPDSVCLTVSLAAGVTAMTREHLAVALALDVPLLIAVTKVDLSPSASKNKQGELVRWETLPAVQSILQTLQTLLSRQPRAEEREREREALLWPLHDDAELQRFLAERETEKDIAFCSVECGSMCKREKIPVLFLSSVSGEGLDLLQKLLFRLDPLSERDRYPHTSTAIERDIENHICVLGAIGRGESWSDEDGEGEDDMLDDVDYDLQDYVEDAARHKKRRKSFSPQSPEQEFAEFLSPSRSSATAREDVLPAKILLGKVLRGRLAVDDELSLGPTTQGAFLRVCVTSVRVHDLPVQFATEGHVATFCLALAPSPRPTQTQNALTSLTVDCDARLSPEVCSKKRDKSKSPLVSPQTSPACSAHSLSSLDENPLQALSPCTVPCVRRRRAAGLVLLSPAPSPSAATWEFLGEVLVVTRSLTPLRINYEPVLHCGALQQAVRLVAIEKMSNKIDKCTERVASKNESAAQELQSEEIALCRFRFVHYPEFLCVGESFILRENCIKAVGKIVNVIG